MSNPALTDTLNNFPLFGYQASSFHGPGSAVENEPPETEREDQAPPVYSPIKTQTPDRSTRRKGYQEGDHQFAKEKVHPPAKRLQRQEDLPHNHGEA